MLDTLAPPLARLRLMERPLEGERREGIERFWDAWLFEGPAFSLIGGSLLVREDSDSMLCWTGIGAKDDDMGERCGGM